VVYQIYPRSFQDSNGDGIGDLAGIISRLDYLKDLGADILWLNPVYESPNDDNGYDISDYRSIHREYGTMADWERLLEEVHRRDMRLIMDLVVNHTSDEHPWFRESRSSRDNPCRDYYIWRPGRNGAEPNNWSSYFSGSAWTLDETTGEYYLHLFSTRQPDLNWENPRVREEIYAMMRWWLDKGIDGFRVDTANMFSKAPGLPDAPEGRDRHSRGQRYQHSGPLHQNGPRIHEFIREMHDRALAPYGVMTVGECPGVDPETAVLYTAPDRREFSMLFQFELNGIDEGPDGYWDPVPWKLADLRRITAKWQTRLHGRGWNSNYLTNHDLPRAVSRLGDDGRYRRESAKLLAAFTMTLEGTPYIYQGEEIGMTNTSFRDIGDFDDIQARGFHREALKRGVPEEEILRLIRYRARDNSRTPMQWDDSPGGGFTSGTPWYRTNPNYREINVREDLAHPESIFRFYRELISLRRSEPALVEGTFRLAERKNPRVFSYWRSLEGRVLLILLNFSSETAEYRVRGIKRRKGRLLLTNYPQAPETPDSRDPLRPWEVRIYSLE